MVSRGLVWVVMAVAFFAGGRHSFAENKPAIYKNNENGFSIRFPGSWEIKEEAGGTAVRATAPLQGKSPGFRPYLSVGVETVPKNTTLEEYASRGIAKARTTMTDFKVYRLGRQTISHTAARWWIISYRADAVTAKGFLFIVVKGSRAYTIVGAAPLELYSSYKTLIADSAGSLVIEGPAAPAR